ncbi:MAG TPA: class I SAM-dependent methyltransferase [Gaiellales bacterium]|nr:class I SAM-dependent methyltransferase [Gaiellales bacterium]
MNAERRAIADELLAAARAHDAAHSDRLARFRNVEPETAELLGVVVRATRARRVLELGTSNGYSTIWLADAVEATGGALTSVEIDPARTALARANLDRAGLTAELVTGDAAEALRASGDGAWDVVFLDAERSAYAGYWPELLRVLRPDGGLVAIDNVLSHAAEVAAVTALIAAEPAVTSALVPVGAGVRLVARSR